MVGKTKKVVLVIVEGICDQTLLDARIKESFKNHLIRFEVVNGDLFYQSEIKNQLIKATVGSRVSDFMKPRKISADDMLAILHIADTDGCFIPQESVVIELGQDKNTLYNSENISVSSELQKERIVSRNKERSLKISVMNSTEKIRKIPYKLFYFSRNLEHVIFDEPNPEGDKYFEVVSFIESLQTPVEEVLNEHMPALGEGSLDNRHIKSRQRTIRLNRGLCVILLGFDLELTTEK